MGSYTVAFTSVIIARNRITWQSSLYIRIAWHLSQISFPYILLNIHFSRKVFDTKIMILIPVYSVLSVQID